LAGLCRLLFDGYHHWHQLFCVVGRLRHGVATISYKIGSTAAFAL